MKTELFFSSIAVALFLFLASGEALGVKQCVFRRAAFDIGSGSTKVKVADVDVCLQKIVKVYWDSQEKVGYKEDLSSEGEKFSQKVMLKGLAVLSNLKAHAEKWKPVAYVGVATSAFRDAKNGELFVSKIFKKTQIKVKIISQRDEAILGFFGAIAKSGVPAEKAVVWDIGGGSMQMVARGGVGRWYIYEGKLASVSFKNWVIEKIQGQSLKAKKSPNPISKDQMNKAITYARKIAKKVPEKILSRLKQKGIEVLGIGGVHYYSIRGQLKTKGAYRLKQVKGTLSKRLGLTDQQVGGKYADTQVSNLILVLSFMKELEIRKVRPLKVNLADGALLNPLYWKIKN